MATSARVGGLVRETLDATSGAARVGALVREALISSGTITAATTIGAITASITGTVLVKATVAETIPAITSAIAGSAPIKAMLVETIRPITLSAQGEVLVKASVGETISNPTAIITGAVTGSVAPLSILGGAWPSLLTGRRLKRRPIAGRLEKSLPPIRCRRQAVVYAANVGARIAPIGVCATAVAGLSEDEQLVVLLLAAGLLE